MTRPGSAMTVYFGDLVLDGQPQDLSRDPQWEGSGNRGKYQPTEIAGYQDFGFSATSNAGGGAGELGGLVWRAPYAYCGDRVGPLSFQDRLEARGRFVLASGAPDSGLFFGWFNSSVKTVDDAAPTKGRDFLGIAIGGPTRIGHYFLPEFATVQGARGQVKQGPILQPGRSV